MIVLFTDFGLSGPYTGQVKAVLHQLCCRGSGRRSVCRPAGRKAQTRGLSAGRLRPVVPSWDSADVRSSILGSAAPAPRLSSRRMGAPTSVPIMACSRSSCAAPAPSKPPRSCGGPTGCRRAFTPRPVRSGGGTACRRHVAQRMALRRRRDQPPLRLAGRLGRDRLYRPLWKCADRATRRNSDRKRPSLPSTDER